MTLALPIVDRNADISSCGRYRYWLTRRWDFDLPVALFVMLNPSTADGDVDDPTIRRCIGLARRWGMGGIEVVNLYPWRATKPRDLPHGPEVFGDIAKGGHERNAVAIRQAALAAGRIVVAWGANPGPCKSHPSVVLDLLRAYDCTDEGVEALALTKHGAPRHPLYVHGDVEPISYGPRP